MTKTRTFEYETIHCDMCETTLYAPELRDMNTVQKGTKEHINEYSVTSPEDGNIHTFTVCDTCRDNAIKGELRTKQWPSYGPKSTGGDIVQA